MNHKISRALAFHPASLVAPAGQVANVPLLVWLLQVVQPRILVQLQVAEGNVFLSACQAVADLGLPARCYGVLSPESSGPGGENPFLEAGPGEAPAEAARRHHAQHFAAFSWLLQVPVAHAVGNFEPQAIDLLLLDASQTAVRIRQDLTLWQPTLSPRAVVLLDGIGREGSEVAAAWATLSGEFPGLALPGQEGMGVLFVGAQVSEDLKAEILRALSDGSASLLAQRGQGLLEAHRCQMLLADVRQQEARLKVMQQETLAEEVAVRQRERACEQREQVLASQEALAARNAALGGELEQLRQEHHVAVQEMHRQAAIVQAMQQSSCWRLTAPIRWVGQPLNRGMRKMSVLRHSVEQHGGFARAGRRALAILRADGLEGVRSRFVNVERMLEPHASQPAGQPPSQDLYHKWLAENDPTDAPALQALRQRVADARLETTFSVVMPVYNPPLDYLRQAIESVRQQVYPHWELCIADDASPRQEVRDMLSEVAAADPRIRLVFCEHNGGISVATNAALGIASGDFIALLDNDDLLTPHALAHMALAIAEHPDADLLYSDEDKVDEDNVRRDPYFKSDFNYELFLAQNMICHLGVYRRSVVEAVGGFRKGVEGAQDWDLALRVLESVGPDRIRHVPRVLYHWRAIAGSTALGIGEKNYAQQAQLQAVGDHLQRIGKLDSTVEMAPAFGLLRVRHAVPANVPLVSIVIPTRDRLELISMCVDSILAKTAYPNYEIVIVDNGSVEPGALAYLQKIDALDNVHVFREDIPFNYSRLVNLGVAHSRGGYLLLLNNDIEIIQPDWIEEMLSFACQEGVGCVGARLWFPDLTLQHGGVVLGIGGVAGHAHKFLPKGQPGYFSRAAAHQVFSAVTAACLMVRRSIYQQVGGLDEVLQVAFNDIDFCIRVREAGYRNLYTPYAEFIHHESASRGTDLSGEKLLRFQQEVATMTSRWQHLLDKDPAYSPNLTLVHEDFSLAWPSRVKPGTHG